MIPKLPWNDRVAWAVHETAFVALLATVVFAPAALGSTYPWSLLGLRWAVAITVALAGLSLLFGRAPGPLSLDARTAHEGHHVARRDAVTRFPALAWISVAWAALALATLASWWMAGATFEVTQATTRALTAMLGFPLAARLVRGPRHVTAFTAALLGTAVVLMGYGVAQALGYGVTPSYSGAARVSSVYFNANHFAGFLDLVVPLAAATAVLARHRVVRLAAAAASVLGLVNVVTSGSRGSWVAVTVALALLAVVVTWRTVRGPRPWKAVRAWVVILLVAFGVAVGAERLVPTWAERSVARFERLVHDLRHPTEFERVAIVLAGLPIVQEHPWWGVGPGNFSYAIAQHRPTAVDDANDGMLHQFVNYAHNDYLQVATESGLLTLTAFLAFWIWVVSFPSPRSPATAWGLRLGLVALLVHGLVDGNLTVITSNAFLAYAAAGCLHARWRWRRRTLS